jgi:hypothetical protein
MLKCWELEALGKIMENDVALTAIVQQEGGYFIFFLLLQL